MNSIKSIVISPADTLKMNGNIKNRLFALVLIVAASLASIVIGEVVVRTVDGYQVMLLRLKPANPGLVKAEPSNAAKKYVAKLPIDPSINPDWFSLTPPPPNPHAEKDFELERRYWANRGFELASIYVWNKQYVKETVCSKSDFGPPHVYAYEPRQKIPYPRFRFLPNKVLPSGLVTNRYGWRGPDITPEKASNVVRIAFVGASTTVNSHGFPFSYPEYVGAWLNRWAESTGKKVKFEIINAGREGTNSNDFAAVVRDELSIVSPDFVVYYEGSNQFWPAHFVEWPNGTLPPKPTLTFSKPSWLEDHSAIFLRLQALRSKRVMLRESNRNMGPVKWPVDLSETDPDLNHPLLPLNLGTILKDVDSIRKTQQARGGELILSSFVWLAHDGMVLDSEKYLNIYRYLNETFWPFSYGHMRRMADFQNRVFKKYAASNQLAFLDVAGEYPQDPELFEDAIHMTQDGVRLHAWVAFAGLVPILESRFKSGQFSKRPPSRSQQSRQAPYSLEAYEDVDIAELKKTCAAPTVKHDATFFTFPANLGISEKQVIDLLAGVSIPSTNTPVKDKAVTIADGTVTVKGDAPSSYAYALGLPQNKSLGEQYLVAEGELFNGGLTLGLLRNNQWAGQVNIKTPGKFKIVMKPEAGEYTVMLAHNVPEQKFNHFKLTKLGWTPEVK